MEEKIYIGSQPAIVGKSQQELVTSYPQEAEGRDRMLLLSSPSPFYTVQDPSPGNCPTHTEQVSPSLHLIRITVCCVCAQRHTLQLISVRLTVNTKQH